MLREALVDNCFSFIPCCSCRPYGVPFFAGLAAPLAVIYIMNWVIFILIFTSLLRKRCNMKWREKGDAKTRFKEQFIIALTLSLLFGLGWGVGFATTSSITSVPLSATLQAIFILLTGFQGLLIFIVQCARRQDARNVWKEWIYTATCHKVHFAKTKAHITSKSNNGKPKISTTESNVAYASSALESADIYRESSTKKEEMITDEPQELSEEDGDGESTQ